MSKASGDWGALIGGATRRFFDFEKISDGEKIRWPTKKWTSEKLFKTYRYCSFTDHYGSFFRLPKSEDQISGHRLDISSNGFCI